jgi:3-oxoacyl-[acyl-carrier protein] reductase
MSTYVNGRAVVCGSTQGIGKAAAWALAKTGHPITLVARNKEKLTAVLQELQRDFPNEGHNFIQADFAHPSDLKNALALFASSHEVRILINNTGGPPAGVIEKAKEEDFISAFQSHLICNHILVQHFLEHMKAAQVGRIVNVISTSVKIPLAGLGVSNTIRAAVANWSKTLANEVAPYGITVNNVLPGATDTVRLQAIVADKAGKTQKQTSEILAHMAHEVPMKRIGRPEEIAAGIAFLASESASYITGINLPVDGGRTGCL